MSKTKFEPYGDSVDQAFSQFNVNSISNQDPHSQIQNDEAPGTEYCNENESEDTQANKISTVPSFIPEILQW